MLRLCVRTLALVTAVTLAARSGIPQEKGPIDADILLCGGSLHVGDGAKPRVGDVALRGGRIVAVGSFEKGSIKREVDCRGLIVCPGYIDLHNHSDRPILNKATCAAMNYLTQGCTLLVTGNCGSGPIHTKAYYDQIDAQGAGVNVAHLFPQGSLRRDVIGSDQRGATEEEIAKMRDLADLAMLEGAWGMSTGLIYVPSSYADTDELASLAEVIGKRGGIYVSHIRNENVRLLDAIDEAIQIGQRAKLPIHISHFKSSGKDAWGLVRIAVQKIEQKRKAGLRVTADQYPYIASSTSLDATILPTWARAGGRKKLIERLDDPDEGRRIRAAMGSKLEKLDGGQRVQVASHAKHPDWVGRRLSDIAKEQGLAPLQLAEQIIRNGGASIVNFSMNEQDIRFAMNHDWVATASDGSAKVPSATSPHPRNYGTFARKIGHYALREKTIPLPMAIRSATGLPADILGLKDRGYLRVGLVADVIAWDPEQVKDAATFENPHQYSRGMRHVFVNGSPAISNGAPTGALYGRAVRRRLKSAD